MPYLKQTGQISYYLLLFCAEIDRFRMNGFVVPPGYKVESVLTSAYLLIFLSMQLPVNLTLITLGKQQYLKTSSGKNI